MTDTQVKMDCPHCGKAFHESWNTTDIGSTWQQGCVKARWFAQFAECPACRNAIIYLRELIINSDDEPRFIKVYPNNSFRKPVSLEVPPDIRGDYEEACNVLSISHQASAALSRRCLQAILQQEGYLQRDLSHQIDALLSESDPLKAIPTGLRQTVDAVRNFGNFSAHRITDQTTLQVIKVEPGEAEWCLEILDEMFDHYYVKPARARERKAVLDAKLVSAGKPPSK